MIKKLAFVVKPILNIVAWFLKLSRHNIYYLVDKPLRAEIQEVSQTVFAYQHIENAIEIAKNLFDTQNGIIADVGGGTATTAAIFSKYFPQHDIYVFEPIKSSFQDIEKASARTEHWKLVNKAVGSVVGSSEINIAARVTASSLLELSGSNTEGYYGEVLQTQRIEKIEITTLDLTLPKNKDVNILKMDVQGFEMEVLKGAKDTLSRCKVIVLEVNNHQGFKGAPTYFEIDEFMRENNFELYDLLPSYREAGKLLDWDAIYVNKSMRK